MSYQQDNFREIADAIREKKGSTALIKPIDFASEIMGISGGGAASQEIFTGYTMPVTYLNCADNTFIYESETHNLAISGLDAVATVTGNGTKKVTVVANVTFTNDEQTSFTITCTKDLESVTYNGIAFHYGNAVASGNCLAVVKTVAGSPLSVKYVFIESVSLPTFSSDTTTWNGVYSYQVESFTFAEFSVSSIGNNFLRYCYSFNQPLTIPSAVSSIGSSFLYQCQSFVYISYNTNVYPTDDRSLSQTVNSKTSTTGSGIVVSGTNKNQLIAALPDRTTTPFRKLVLGA